MAGLKADQTAVSMAYGKADRKVAMMGGMMAVWTDGRTAERMVVHLAGPMVG